MDVYKVGIALAMSSNHAQVLGALSSQLFHIHARVGQLTGGFNRLKLAIGGALATTAGVGLLHGIGAILDKTKDLSHELVQIKKLGIEADQFAAMRREALKVTRNIAGVSEVDAIKTYGAGYSMFGHENTIKLMEPLQKFAQVVGNTTGNFEKASDDLYKMIRSADLMGKFTNPETHLLDTGKLQEFLDIGSKVILATHGKVDAAQWLSMAQTGGPALSSLSKEGLVTSAIVAQAMGGFRAGTAMMSTFQQMIGGITTQRTVKSLADLGLVDMDKVDIGRGGQVRLNKGAISDETIGRLKSDPLAFVMDTLIPAMTAKGITKTDDQVAELFKIFGRQTTVRMMHDLLRNRDQIQGERGRVMGAMDVDPSKKLQDTEDYTQALHNTRKAWDNLLYAIAGPNNEHAIKFLNSLTGALNSLTEAVRATNPEAIKAIGIGIAVLGAALIGAGAAAILAAIGPAGWLAAGIIALGGAMAAVVDWKKAKAEWDALTAWLSSDSISRWLTDTASEFAQAIGKLPAMVTDAITGAISGIADIFKNALKSLLPGLGSGAGPQPDGSPAMPGGIPMRYEGPGIGPRDTYSDIGQGRMSTGSEAGDNVLRDATAPSRARPSSLPPNVRSAIGGNDGGGAPAQSSPSRRMSSLPPNVGNAIGGTALGPAAALSIARQHLGEHEIADRGKLARFFAAHGYRVDPRTTAWCATFVNSSLAAAGVRGTGSNVANSFLGWGQPVDPGNIQAGDVLVQHRGRGVGQTGGHVGFATGLTRTRRGRLELEMISGNKSDRVGKNFIGAGQVRVRRPSVPPPPRKQESAPVEVHTHNFMDGRKMAEVITRHQTRALDRPAHGGQQPDFYRHQPTLA